VRLKRREKFEYLLTGQVMRITIDTATKTFEDADGTELAPLYSPEAFRAISDLWLRVGWSQKYTYSFTWCGVPIIQLPEDMFRIQELICRIKPDFIVETGVAHGGSLMFYASLCKTLEHGRVIGVDIEIRPHNRKGIEAHRLFEHITLVEGDSVDEKTVAEVAAAVAPGERGMVILDSKHTKDHVLAELEAYSQFVAVDSYVIACDGIMEGVVGAPGSRPDWDVNNPRIAAEQFAATSEAFVIEEPEFAFNEGSVTERVTYWPGGILRRVK